MTECRTPLRIIEEGPGRLALAGDLDLAGMPQLEAALAGCDGDVVLDCSGLTFVGAAALDLFVRTRNDCEARGMRFTLVAPSDGLVRLLSMTGLDSVFLTGAAGPGR